MIIMALFVAAGAAPVAATATLLATGVGTVLGWKVDERRLAKIVREAEFAQTAQEAMGGTAPDWDERTRAFPLLDGAASLYVDFAISGRTFRVTERQRALLFEALLEEKEDAVRALVGKIIAQQPRVAA